MRSCQTGGVVLTEADAGHLREAISQIDPLLRAARMEDGLIHLIRLLQHLRAVRIGGT
jgi:hypothetical protein